MTLAVRPTHVRYAIVGIAMLAATLLYLERVCVGVAEVYIREDLRIGKTEMDLAFGAFFVAYALGQVPSGWLSQRYGPRAMMTLYMIGWSVFGVFIALAQDFWTLFFARFLLGLSQAGAYPTAALQVKRWVPDRSRGLASGVVSFGGRVGGAGANWLTGVLIVAFVPITRPATVTEADVQHPGLIERRRSPDVPTRWLGPLGPVRQTVADSLPYILPDLRDGVERMPGPVEREISRGAAVEALNGLIRTPQAFPDLDWSNISLAADGKAILAKPPAERTQAESERLNRLVIEKAFPGAIRQLHTDGWRPTLMSYGVLGVVVGGLFWVVARDWPRRHPWANAAEVNLIESGQSHVGEAASDAIPFGPLIRSRNQWLFSLNQFASNFGWVFLITLMPRFLDEKFHVPVDQRGLMTTIPLVVAAFGMLVGGWFTDWLTRARGHWLGRSIPMGAFKFPCAVALAVSPWLPGPWAVTAALAFMAVCQDFGVPAVWAFAQDTAGKQVGAVLGWANMWGNFGAGVAIYTTGRIADNFGWNAAFWTIGFAFAMAGVAGMMANAAIPLFRGGPEDNREITTDS